MLPLDVYLENEFELVSAPTAGETVEELKGTVGEKLMRRDAETRVVVNFHGVSLPFPFSALQHLSILSIFILLSPGFHIFCL